MTRLHTFFFGKVQGVGFRYTTQRVAGGFAVTGWVRNRSDGRVELVAEGEQAQLEQFLAKIGDEMDGCFDRVERAWQPATGEFKDFAIKATQ